MRVRSDPSGRRRIGSKSSVELNVETPLAVAKLLALDTLNRESRGMCDTA